MRHRGFLLILAATALGSLVMALSLHQTIQEERLALVTRESTKKCAGARTSGAPQEADQLGVSSSAAEVLAQELETSLGELKDRVDRLEKNLAGRDQAHLASLGEIKAGVADLKTQMAAQNTAITLRLEEIRGARDAVAQVTSQLSGLESQLKEKEAQIQGASSERNRLTEDLKQQQANLERLGRALAAERDVPPGATPRRPGIENRTPPVVPVRTKIEAIEASDEVVVLGAGKSSGLDTGHVLFVSREGKPVGRVRVIKIYDDLAGAEILDTEPDETIRRHDKASTEAAPAESTPVVLPIPLTKRDPPPPPPPPQGGNAGK